MTQLQPIASALDSETKLQNFLAGRPRLKDNGEPQYQERDPAKLQTQINGLSDVLALTVRQRDQLQQTQITHQANLQSLGLKLWILGGIALAQTGIIGWFATELFSRLK